MENFKNNKILKNNKIEISLFFIFFIYFSLWVSLNSGSISLNNDVLEEAIKEYSYIPYLSYIINEFVFSNKINILLGTIVFPSLCVVFLFKIFNKILSDNLWAISLTLLSILSSENFPFIKFLKSTFFFSEIIENANKTENFEIIGFPIPSFTIFYFLVVFYYSYRFVNLDRYFLILFSLLWLVGIHLHPVDGLFGLLYWTVFILMNVFLKKIQISLKDSIIIFLAYLLNLLFVFYNLNFLSLEITAPQEVPVYGLFVYFFVPVLFIALTINYFKVDLYEFFLKFFAIYILMLIELVLIIASLRGYGVELQMLENRITLFLLHFLYYLPIIYYLNKDSIYYENFLPNNSIKIYISKIIYFIFNKYKSFYLIPFSFLLIVYAFLSLNI